MENLARAICAREGLSGANIQVLTGGQVNQVFLIDNAYVLRIGSRADAFKRLQRETELLRSLAGKIPVPEILAFGQHDERVYQIQQYLPGQKLYLVWKDLPPEARDRIAAELASYIKLLHSQPLATPGFIRQDGQRFDTWEELITKEFRRTLDEIQALKLRMVPGFIEMAANYFEENKDVLRYGTPALIHGDLTLINVLVNEGKISALLDFEYSLQAPIDYELLTMETFCLYPNDWAEEDHEVFCTDDFSGFFSRLRAHYPGLFMIPNLRKRLNLYQIASALSSYLAWRKDNLETIPPERMAAKEFYMARITNFIFRHGTRMFEA